MVTMRSKRRSPMTPMRENGFCHRPGRQTPNTTFCLPIHFPAHTRSSFTMSSSKYPHNLFQQHSNRTATESKRPSGRECPQPV